MLLYWFLDISTSHINRITTRNAANKQLLRYELFYHWVFSYENESTTTTELSHRNTTINGLVITAKGNIIVRNDHNTGRYLCFLCLLVVLINKKKTFKCKTVLQCIYSKRIGFVCYRDKRDAVEDKIADVDEHERSNGRDMDYVWWSICR